MSHGVQRAYVCITFACLHDVGIGLVVARYVVMMHTGAIGSSIGEQKTIAKRTKYLHGSGALVVKIHFGLLRLV